MILYGPLLFRLSFPCCSIDILFAHCHQFLLSVFVWLVFVTETGKEKEKVSGLSADYFHINFLNSLTSKVYFQP